MIAYVDNNLVGTGKIHQAAILGLQGGVWATSSGFTVGTLFTSHRLIMYLHALPIKQISPEEQTQIINSLKTPGQAQSNGVRVSGKKYFALKVEEDRIYGKQSVSSPINIPV